MKRIPVTQASYKKLPKSELTPGKTIQASSHPIDKEKSRTAASFMGGFGRPSWNRPTMLGGSTSFYNNSYMSGGNSSGFGDVPQYFAFLNESNGGILYYPVTLKEKYEWYRYFFRCFVDENVEILTANGTNKKISELQNGDTIINGCGKKVEVINKVENEYKGDVFSIFVENGKKSTFVTADHLYLVIEKESVIKHHNRTENGRKTFVEIKKEPIWKRADELKIGDYVLTTYIDTENESNELSIEEARDKIKEKNVIRRYRKICYKNWLLYPIRKIEKKHYEGKVFCITTNGKNYDDCSFVANGLVNHNCDPYVHAAISLHTDLPMSKLVLRMPKMADKVKRKKILSKYQTMVNDLKLFDKLHSILFETNIIGNCFPQGNRVITPEGLIDISDIEEGQSVLSNNGVYNRVSKKMSRETTEELVRIKVHKLNTRNITCTKEHPIFVLRDGKDICIEAKDLTENDYVSVSQTVYDKEENLDYIRRRITPRVLQSGELEIGESESIRIFTGFLKYGIPVSKLPAEKNRVKIFCTVENLFAFMEKRNPINNSDFDYVKCINGKFYYKISKIDTVQHTGKVYNLEVEKDHTYCVEHINTHNCFAFVQYNEEKQTWDKITILPPEEVDVANYPMSDIKCIQYRPEILNSILSKYSFPIDDYNKYCKYVEDLDEDEKAVLQGVDFELVKQLKENNGALLMDTNPYSGEGNSKIGSFVFHFCEKRHEYQDLGVSPLECILTPLLMKEHYKHTQLSLASRNMTPRNLVTAEGINQEALDDLREQIDQSMLSPDFSIVTNYQVNWETIGSENRLIDLSKEYETIENQIFAGLSTTREILTGEGMYSGNKISVEILNTRYLLKREFLQNFVEESLFKPIALQNGFYEDDEDGNRTWYYPKLSFTRLTIRDNAEVFDSLFQLYQKGSIPIGTILDLFNLDEDEVDEKLKRDMFTPKDAVYNDMLRGVYSQLGDKLITNTDLAKQVIESITGPQGSKLVFKQDEENSEESYGDDYNYSDDTDETSDWNDDSSFYDEDVTNDEAMDAINDIVDEEDLQKDLENQSPVEEKKLEEYLEQVQEETNQEKEENSEEKTASSFKVAKKI